MGGRKHLNVLCPAAGIHQFYGIDALPTPQDSPQALRGGSKQGDKLAAARLGRLYLGSSYTEGIGSRRRGRRNGDQRSGRPVRPVGGGVDRPAGLGVVGSVRPAHAGDIGSEVVRADELEILIRKAHPGVPGAGPVPPGAVGAVRLLHRAAGDVLRPRPKEGVVGQYRLPLRLEGGALQALPGQAILRGVHPRRFPADHYKALAVVGQQPARRHPLRRFPGKAVGCVKVLHPVGAGPGLSQQEFPIARHPQQLGPEGPGLGSGQALLQLRRRIGVGRAGLVAIPAVDLHPDALGHRIGLHIRHVVAGQEGGEVRRQLHGPPLSVRHPQLPAAPQGEGEAVQRRPAPLDGRRGILLLRREGRPVSPVGGAPGGPLAPEGAGQELRPVVHAAAQAALRRPGGDPAHPIVGIDKLIPVVPIHCAVCRLPVHSIGGADTHRPRAAAAQDADVGVPGLVLRRQGGNTQGEGQRQGQ